ncbi:MAG TPA: malonyl-CoA decarboxylase [Beijerinckiaceae bacterium]|nr:malonyl-CoA decarboxylase [Beijerinckiaceae bacterium]
MNGTYFSELLSSIAERGRQLLGVIPGEADPARRAASLADLCEQLLSGRGEASGTALAREVLDRYATLDPDGRRAFFEALARSFGPARDRLEAAVAAWRTSESDAHAADLHYLAEPRRVELFRRLNRAPGGTASLVEMRTDLLALVRRDPGLEIVDRDLAHLLSSWFNRGFLVLRRVDWSSPAIVLEKIIRYEAVHEIQDWDDLRRRIDFEDRRCYAFFHPALSDEPLIFVEVALAADMPGAIEPLLAQDRTVTRLAEARIAVFYSISNCQRGLSGISFGNFLIKQVVEELRRELPKLTTFVTLSPVPGFMTWLRAQPDATLLAEQRDLIAKLDNPRWVDDRALSSELRAVIEPLTARYFVEARTADQRIVDSVARFHLGNGARLERINWLGNRSPKALAESAGVMVNYLYDLDRIESNHEAYANNRDVVASGAVKRLLRALPRPKAVALPSPSTPV